MTHPVWERGWRRCPRRIWIAWGALALGVLLLLPIWLMRASPTRTEAATATAAGFSTQFRTLTATQWQLLPSSQKDALIGVAFDNYRCRGAESAYERQINAAVARGTTPWDAFRAIAQTQNDCAESFPP